jgi:hypothetical protein
MGKAELQSFFDLGNSTRRGDNATIGEKGHGTKVYFNSKNSLWIHSATEHALSQPWIRRLQSFIIGKFQL